MSNLFKYFEVIHWKRINLLSGSTYEKNFFSQSVTDGWNKLPQYAVDALSTNSFKKSLDKYWSKSDMVGI